MPFEQSSERARLAGRYELIALLGAGAMGSVYKAIDRELDDVVAVKVLSDRLVQEPEMLQRFRREVKLARKVTHANVARVFDIGEHGRDRFLTMEYIDGGSLGDLVAREGALPLGRVGEIAQAVCAGLASAHAAGVIHRDLKPDNVLVSRTGRIAITDFGVARAVFLEGSTQQTIGHVIGTPAYMAPEQVEAASDIGPPADIYALGAMLYELVTGRRAWTDGSPLAVAAARLTHPPPDPRRCRPDAPPALAELVMSCMARERGARPASALDVAAELAALLPELSRTVDRARAVRSIVPQSSRASAGSEALAEAQTAWAIRAGEVAALAGRHDRTLAVLPLRNAGPPEDDTVAAGLTEEIIDRLSMTHGLRVCSRGLVAPFAEAPHATVDVRAAGAELGVQVVAEASIHRADDSVRVSARLISVADGFQLWAKRFDASARDLLRVGEELASAIAAALGAERDPASERSLTDPAVIDLYLRARAATRTIRGAVSLIDPSLPLWERAVSLAPDSPSVAAGYAMACARRWIMGEGPERAIAAATRAVELAPTLGEARLAFGYVEFLRGDAVSAVREAKRAVSLAPGLPEGHLLVGRILTEAGYVDEGIRRLVMVIQLDEQLRHAHSDLARGYALLGEWDRAFAVLDRFASVDKSKAMLDRLRLQFWRRDPSVFEGDIEQALGNDSMGATFVTSIVTATREGRNPNLDAQVAAFFGELTVLRNAAFYAQLRAELAAFIGDSDAALTAIANAVEHGLIDALWMERCPLFDGIRDTSRFATSRAEVNARARRIIDAFQAE